MGTDDGSGNPSSSVMTLEPYSFYDKRTKNLERKKENVKLEKFRKMEVLPGLYEIVNYEKFLILQFENGRHENLNIFRANREIIRICGSQPKISQQGNGSLLIETSENNIDPRWT